MFFVSRGIELFHRYIKNKFIRFIFVGGLNTVFGYSVYCLMILLGLTYLWATVVQQVLGTLFNFRTTGALVFENSDRKLLIKFILNYVITYFLSIAVNKLLQIALNFNTYYSGLGGTVIAAIASFFLLKYFVFNNSPNKF